MSASTLNLLLRLILFALVGLGTATLFSDSADHNPGYTLALFIAISFAIPRLFD